MFDVPIREEASVGLSLAFLAVQMILHFGAMALAVPRPGRRAAARLCMLGSACVSWLMPGHTVMRFAGGMFVVLGVLRVVDLTTWRELSLRMRVWTGVAIYDTWRWRRIPAQIDRSLFRRWSLSTAFALGGLWIAYVVADRLQVHGGDDWGRAYGQAARYAVRWIVGGLAFVALVESIDNGARLFYARVGIWVPPIQRAPHRSLSLDEFWGRRWNTVVCAWFRRHIFAPLARRGFPRMAMAASFAASVLMHLWTVAVPAGSTYLLPMGGFFALHGLLTLLESALGVRRWSRSKARAWTLGIVILSSPLFVEPMLTIFDLR